MKPEYESFMNQFVSAKEDVKRMPGWLKESTKVATLTFPSSARSAPTTTPKASIKRKP
jgi:hypothetical protein